MNASKREVADPSVEVFDRHDGSSPSGNDRPIGLLIVGVRRHCAAIRIC
jgi:hypothetical protein